MSFTVSSPISFRATKTLLGFRSRWTTPRAWAWASASQTCRPTCTASPIERRRRAARMPSSVRPSSISSTTYGPCVAHTPASSTSTKPGWRTAVERVRLAQQPAARLLLGAELVGQELERDDAARELVARLEDEAHAAMGNEPAQLVAGVDCLPDERFGHFFHDITRRATPIHRSAARRRSDGPARTAHRQDEAKCRALGVARRVGRGGRVRRRARLRCAARWRGRGPCRAVCSSRRARRGAGRSPARAPGRCRSPSRRPVRQRSSDCHTCGSEAPDRHTCGSEAPDRPRAGAKLPTVTSTRPPAP